MLSVLTQILSNRSQFVVVDDGRSKLFNVVRSASGKCSSCTSQSFSQ